MKLATNPCVWWCSNPRWAALLLSSLLPVLGWAADVPPPEPVVELPKVVVTDSRDLPRPEPWRYATIPGFEILSDTSDRATQRLLADFQMFRQALSAIWQVPDKMNTPLLLILCGKNGMFETFLPAKTDGTPDTGRASVYLKGRLRSAIVIDMAATVINLLPSEVDDPASGIDSTRMSVEHNKQLYREYVHYLLSRAEPRLPAWYEEGMAQIIMAMYFDERLIEFGKIHEANIAPSGAGAIASANAAIASASTAAANGSVSEDESAALIPGAPVDDRDFNAVLANRALIPMQQFFDVSHDAPAALNPLGNNRWAKQAYAFVHMCMFGERGQWKKPFSQFLLRSTREPVTEAMFKQCFNMSYGDMAIQLRGYIQWTSYTSQEFHAKKGQPGLTIPAPLALRDATQSEVGRIKGEAKLLAGNVDGAHTELIAPYVRGERDPQLLAGLGLLEHAMGKDERARRFLTVATTSKVNNPEAYLELARFHYADALAKPEAANGQFSTEQVNVITGLLNSARHFPPPNPATYELLAETLARGAAKPTKEQVVPLIEGVQLYPGRMKLVYETAALCADAGFVEAAHSLVDHGMKFATDPNARAAFTKMKSTLPPDPGAAKGASAAPASGAPAAPMPKM